MNLTGELRSAVFFAACRIVGICEQRTEVMSCYGGVHESRSRLNSEVKLRFDG